MMNIKKALALSEKIRRNKYDTYILTHVYECEKYFYVNLDTIENMKNKSELTQGTIEIWLKIDRRTGKVEILDFIEVIADEYYHRCKRVWSYK